MYSPSQIPLHHTPAWRNKAELPDSLSSGRLSRMVWGFDCISTPSIIPHSERGTSSHAQAPRYVTYSFPGKTTRLFLSSGPLQKKVGAMMGGILYSEMCQNTAASRRCTMRR